MESNMNTDRILSITAIVVALGTLFVIVYQTHLTRQAQRATVLPYLQMGFSFDANYASIQLMNSGVGPALIDEIRIVNEGDVFEGDPSAFLSQRGLDLSNMNLHIDMVLPGMLIPAEQITEMLGVYSPQDKTNLIDIFNVVGNEESTDGAIIEISYSSVYGEQWTIRSDEIIPVSK